MSTIKHPVGPQSSKVYWRRRLVVGLGLLAVLVILLLIIVRPGSSSGDPKTTTPPASTDAASTPSTGTAGGSTAAAGTAGTCDPRVVQVEAITDAGSYAADVLPLLSLSVTNTGAAPCTLNAGTAAQVFTISSGSDVYWTSTDCQTDAADADVTLEPGVTVSSSTPVAWDRTRSSTDTCTDETRDAAPGEGAYYNLSVSVDGIESESSTQFMLE